MRWKSHVRFGGRAGETHRSKDGRALRPDPYTEHPTREGKVYCCVVLDACSRRVVGWSIDSAQTSTLVTNALGMAISNRQPVAGSGLIIHSDQGVQGGLNQSTQHRVPRGSVGARRGLRRVSSIRGSCVVVR